MRCKNKAVVYGILFCTVAETLRTIAALGLEKYLGVEIGFFAVLHTWGSNLLQLPCIFTWSCPAVGFRRMETDADLFAGLGYFLPVQVLCVAVPAAFY